jgi:pimeloyl-ACP methyl ester carboxylesterase
MTPNNRPTGQVRADGPAVVRKGPTGQPAVVVLDPLGDAKHGELPATWRPLAEDVEVIWWRLPTMVREGRDVASLVASLARDRRLHLVGAGDAARLALSLAEGHRAAVASVVLVDPPWPVGDRAVVRDITDDPTLAAFQVATGPEEALPIGHPDVVRAVLQALLSADLWPADPTRGGVVPVPAAESLASQAWEAVRLRLADLLRALDVRRT